jgi:hypothetical protein
MKRSLNLSSVEAFHFLTDRVKSKCLYTFCPFLNLSGVEVPHTLCPRELLSLSSVEAFHLDLTGRVNSKCSTFSAVSKGVSETSRVFKDLLKDLSAFSAALFRGVSESSVRLTLCAPSVEAFHSPYRCLVVKVLCIFLPFPRGF